MTYRLYWGDLHSHCSISYGHGTVRQALLRAREQLDFCSVTGHAFWPDMPRDREAYGEIIDYHNTGFSRLARNWRKLLDDEAAACVPGEFLALPSYEWHSLQFGDHNVYFCRPGIAAGGRSRPADAARPLQANAGDRHSAPHWLRRGFSRHRLEFLQ